MASADPTASIIFFLRLTRAYSIFKYYTKSPSMLKIWTGIYFLVLIIVQFFINLGLTNEICGTTQYWAALRETLIPWVLIFGLLHILLMVFPSWLNPFSNTIGYFFALLTGVNSFLKSILKDRTNVNVGPNEKEMITALNNVYEDKGLLINSMTLENISVWWESMNKGGLLKSGVGNEQFIQLENFVKMKTIIAEFIWYVLTGVLVTSISYNSIVNSGCTQSAKEMEERYEEYQQNENKMKEAQSQKQNQQVVYKSFE